MAGLQSSAHVDVVFINPWGNMCDYYKLLNANIELNSVVVKLKLSLSSLLKPIPLNKQELEAQLSYQILRRKGKLDRGLPFPRWAFVPRLALAAHKVLYRYQFIALFNFAYTRFLELKPKCVCVWNGHRLREKAAIAAAEQLGLPVLYFENGYLPNTTSIDPQGVNDACSLPRNPDFYLDFAKANITAQLFTIDALDVRQPIESKPLQPPHDLHAQINDEYIFVPFQVDLDSQLLVNSSRLKTMRAFYQEVESVAVKNPQWTFVVKEHPSCKMRYDDLYKRQANIIFTNNNTEQLIKNARVILTINSSVGMEAIIFHKPVITLGKAFYNIQGMVKQAENAAQIETHINTIYANEWQPNHLLIDAFIAFLQKHYLVDIAWRRADDHHFKQMSARIQKFIRSPELNIWD